MKKLLSILIISTGLVFYTSTTVSCNNILRTKVNISKNIFKDIDEGTGQEVYNKIKNQIGFWAKPIVNSTKISDDQNINISLY